MPGVAFLLSAIKSARLGRLFHTWAQVGRRRVGALPEYSTKGYTRWTEEPSLTGSSVELQWGARGLAC